MNPFYISLLFALFTAIPTHAGNTADEKRLNEVTERGMFIMPFDLEKTTHVFSKTVDGGIQQVFANDQFDKKQIKLIQDHLSEISAEFKQGDFSKPAHIHGRDMPGLTVLKSANPGQINIEYLALSNGAQIIYSTQLPQFIKAIHQWFDAQLSDHARHAVPGHLDRHIHQK